MCILFCNFQIFSPSDCMSSCTVHCKNSIFIIFWKKKKEKKRKKNLLIILPRYLKDNIVCMNQWGNIAVQENTLVDIEPKEPTEKWDPLHNVNMHGFSLITPVFMQDTPCQNSQLFIEKLNIITRCFGGFFFQIIVSMEQSIIEGVPCIVWPYGENDQEEKRSVSHFLSTLVLVPLS